MLIGERRTGEKSVSADESGRGRTRIKGTKKKERKKGKRGGVGRIKEKIGAFNSKAREEKRTWGGEE